MGQDWMSRKDWCWRSVGAGVLARVDHSKSIAYLVRGGLTSAMKKKCKGRSRKPLAEVYSQERPVARHFVWGVS